MAEGSEPFDLADDVERGSAPPRARLLHALFFVSGFPALLYQLVWQRSLFTIYGTNVESVTVVVTAFLLGLGLGSALGGRLSTLRVPPLALFGIFELAIGAFGAVSLSVFHAVGGLTLDLSPISTGLVCLGLVLLPTLLMGATLPLLCAHLVRRSGNVGRSVGSLYAANTLGSGVACLVAGLLLFGALGQRGVVHVAAVLNVLVGAGALVLASRAKEKRPAGSSVPAADGPLSAPSVVRPGLALFVAFVSGFVALSYEILWFRVYAFASGGRALIFPILLGTMLFGIAAGSWLARRACRGSDPATLLRRLLRVLAAGTAAGYLLAPVVARLSTSMPWWATFPLVAVAAAILGAAFPLVCHLGVAPGARAGEGTSRLYVANIAGSVAGSLATGFFLLDALPFGRISLVLAGTGIVACAFLVSASWAADDDPAARRSRILDLSYAVLLVVSMQILFVQFYERLYFGVGFDRQRFARLVETRTGVVTVTKEGEIQGGGAYDGWFSTDLVDDKNGVFRAYASALYHEGPKEILVVGLASGSWAQVLSNHPTAERVTIVEIDDGYLRVIPHYPVVSSLMTNPKVEIAIDDGRRWLRRHPDRRFDLVLQNTTQHWRGNVTNLLSEEYAALVRAHLKPGGVFTWNTTWSKGAMRTGALAFPHAIRIGNFMVGSESPIALDKERWRRALLAWRIDGHPVIDPANARHAERLEAVLSIVDTLASDYGPRKSTSMTNLETREGILERTKGFPVLTDDNMGDEWVIDP